MSYHNNLFDVVQALSHQADVRILSPRPIHGRKYLPAPVAIDTLSVWKFPQFDYPAMISPLDLWRKLNSSTTHVVTKHRHTASNIIPWLIAKLRGIPVFTIEQHQRRNVVHVLSFLLGVKTFPAPPCINPDRFAATTHASSQSGQLSVLTVAKFQQRKNLDVLVRAMTALVGMDTTHQWRLTIIGAGGSHQERKHLQSLIEELGVSDVISLHHDVAAAEMPQHYAIADVFVLPASKEPLGYAVLEAMASSLPVVTTTDVGAAQYLSAANRDFVIPPKSVTALRAALERISADRIHMRQIGTANRKQIVQHHAPDAILSQINNHL